MAREGHVRKGHAREGMGVAREGVGVMGQTEVGQEIISNQNNKDDKGDWKGRKSADEHKK